MENYDPDFEVEEAPKKEPASESFKFEFDSLVDKFAMAALNGMLSNPNCKGNHKENAVNAFLFAAAMMEERKKYV